MRRYLLALISLLLVAACAATPEPRYVSSASTQARGELECMGDCLADGDVTCEACIDRCMENPVGAAIAAQISPQPLQ